VQKPAGAGLRLLHGHSVQYAPCKSLRLLNHAGLSIARSFWCKSMQKVQKSAGLHLRYCENTQKSAGLRLRHCERCKRAENKKLRKVQKSNPHG
jgi:hypothetical protein